MSEQTKPALPVLTPEQKFFIRDLQFGIAQTSINITNIQQKAQNDVRVEQQKSQQLAVQLRAFLENIANQNSLDFTKITFDLDTLSFKEIAASAPTPEAPAPTEPASAAAAAEPTPAA